MVMIINYVIEEKKYMNDYQREVYERWGNTDAYCDYEKKTKNYSKEKWVEINDGLMSIFSEFAECKNNEYGVNSSEVQSLVGKLQDYITQNYYACTNEILASLGQIYVADERFKKNINKHGEGTAEFVSDAIATFCQLKDSLGGD